MSGSNRKKKLKLKKRNPYVEIVMRKGVYKHKDKRKQEKHKQDFLSDC
jgi:hypothetical protein